jgi:hypothetical protein
MKKDKQSNQPKQPKPRALPIRTGLKAGGGKVWSDDWLAPI